VLLVYIPRPCSCEAYVRALQRLAHVRASTKTTQPETHTHTKTRLFAASHMPMCAEYVYICACVCMYIYIYIYNTHIHTRIQLQCQNLFVSQACFLCVIIATQFAHFSNDTSLARAVLGKIFPHLFIGDGAIFTAGYVELCACYSGLTHGRSNPCAQACSDYTFCVRVT